MTSNTTQRWLRVMVAAILTLALAACTAPASQERPNTAAKPVASTPADAPPAPAPRSPASKPRLGASPVALDTSCSSDADCAVKDVGSCCGYAPACVNTASPTDPAAVKAQCEASGMSSICGFREISACTCNAGKCEAAGSAAPVAQ